MKKLIYLFVCITPALFIHCKKESPATESRLALLTSRKWKIDKLLYSVKGDPNILNFTSAAYKACELDDVYEFEQDFSFKRTDGFTICGSVALYAPYGNAAWVADSALTQLTVELFSIYSYKFKVVSLTATELQLERSTLDYLQQPLLYTYFFKRST